MSVIKFTSVPHGSDTFRHALDWEKLPTDDLDEPGRNFFCLWDDDKQVGFIGLEGEGPDCLLRSLVVKRPYLRKGYGRQLVEWLEGWAREGEIERLHLLTDKHAPFFQRLGYTITERASAPASIASTTQFASLCPASATYMTKTV